MTIEDLNQELKEPKNWIEIYSQKVDIYEIFFSIQYDSQLGNPLSLVLLKDNYKFSYIDFNKDLTQFADLKVIVNVQEIDFNTDSKNFKHKDIIGVHHYNSMIYICFKQKVYIYNLKVKTMIDLWNFDKDTIKDLYILDQKTSYYLIFLTTRNVYFSNIEQKFEDQVNLY